MRKCVYTACFLVRLLCSDCSPGSVSHLLRSILALQGGYAAAARSGVVDEHVIGNMFVAESRVSRR